MVALRISSIALVWLLASCSGGGSGGSSGSNPVTGNGPGAGGDPGTGNSAPIAVASADTTAGEAPLTVTFDSRQTADPDGDIVSFAWDFGDGTGPIVSETAVHTYSSAGLFQASLTVSDSAGSRSTAEVIIEVASGGVDVPAACPVFSSGVSQGALESSAIVEASGIASSRKNAGVLWVNNDSGDSARLFAMTWSGRHLGVYSVAPASAYDWEDLAVGPGPEEGADYLYVADIGDNARARAYVTVYRVLEPEVDAAQAPGTFSLGGAVALKMKYPSGSWDAEALFVDPESADIFIVTKRSDGQSEVLRNPAPHDPASTVTMDAVARLAFGTSALPGSTLVTSGDMSARGDWIILRTYSHAFLWRREPGETVGDAFSKDVCAVPARSEPQGEAIGFAADGSGYFTVSEGSHPPLYFFGRTVQP